MKRDPEALANAVNELNNALINLNKAVKVLRLGGWLAVAAELEAEAKMVRVFVQPNGIIPAFQNAKDAPDDGLPDSGRFLREAQAEQPAPPPRRKKTESKGPHG